MNVVSYSPYSSVGAPWISDKWMEGSKLRSSVGKVMCNGHVTGCGILIGIDRMLVPYHVIQGTCPNILEVYFQNEDGNYCYPHSFKVVQFLDYNSVLDFCILHLSKNTDGLFAGNVISFPKISIEHHNGDFLFIRFDGNSPSAQKVNSGWKCSPSHFCSIINTSNSTSGCGYLNQELCLFAMHLSRSTGVCGNQNVRRALYLSEVYLSSQKAQALLSMPVCMPVCEKVVQQICAPIVQRNNLCFVDEGKPAVHDTFNNIQYWEYFPTNAKGGGPRGIAIAPPNSRCKLFYKFKENPHDVRAYNKDQEQLYLNAVVAYSKTNCSPNQFEFQAYGNQFHAILEGKIDFTK